MSAPPRGRARRARRRRPARRSRRPRRAPRRRGRARRRRSSACRRPRRWARSSRRRRRRGRRRRRPRAPPMASRRPASAPGTSAQQPPSTQRLARRWRRRRARPRARPLVIASVSAMPITPVAGSRSSPRIRTSRSPRSSAPRRAEQAVLAHGRRRLLGPAGTPDGVDRHADRGPGRRHAEAIASAIRCASPPGRRSARPRHARRAGCEPAGRLVHTTVGAGASIARAGACLLGGGDRLGGAEGRARRGQRGEDLVGVEAAVVPDDQAGPARGREIGDHPVAAGGRDVLRRAEARRGRSPPRGRAQFTPSKPVHATLASRLSVGDRDRRLAAVRAVALQELGGAEAVARRPHGDLVEDRPAGAALGAAAARSRPDSSARRR